jgi:ketosteroid isomerase-like protein
MAEVDVFLTSTMPRLREAEIALHNGDARPRSALWSRSDPLTLFGAVMSATGWAEIGPAFERLATTFSDCTSHEYEVTAADVSGDLAYVVGIEHTTASVGGAPPTAYALRVTTVFRRDEGDWRVVHRHADPIPGSTSTRDQLGRLEHRLSTDSPPS